MSSQSPVCPGCSCSFSTARAFSQHLNRSIYCQNALSEQIRQENTRAGSAASAQMAAAQLTPTSTSKAHKRQKTSDMCFSTTTSTSTAVGAGLSSLMYPADETHTEDGGAYLPSDNSDTEVENENKVIADAVDESLYNQQQARDATPTIPPTATDKTQVQLLDICKQTGAPLYAYDLIMDWAAKASNSGHTFSSNFAGRTTVINDLYTRYDMHGTKPFTVSVKLSTGRVVNVAVCNFLQQILSLLNDKNLMQDDNLVLGDNPTDRPLPRGCNFGEFHSGTLYRRAREEYCKDKDNFLCPLQLFIDKTFIDLNARCNAEPVVFTLTIFKRHIRRQPRAWRPLGFVSDLYRQSSAQTKKQTQVN